MTAKKFDNNKPDHTLIPKIALDECAYAFMLGEKKYGRYNYTAGMEASRLIAAAQRHLTTWFDGEDTDPESGRSHMGHALACIAMLLRMQELGTLKDNRYNPPAPAEVFIPEGSGVDMSQISSVPNNITSAWTVEGLPVRTYRDEVRNAQAIADYEDEQLQDGQD